MTHYRYDEHNVTAEAYNQLRERSGMGKKSSLERVQIALDHSLYRVNVYDGERLIGHGRIVGDGGLSYIISDVMVESRYQGQGIGKQIVQRLTMWLDEHTEEDSFVTLIAVPPADRLYAQYGFEAQADRVGMRRWTKRKK